MFEKLSTTTIDVETIRAWASAVVHSAASYAFEKHMDCSDSSALAFFFQACPTRLGFRHAFLMDLLEMSCLLFVLGWFAWFTYRAYVRLCSLYHGFIRVWNLVVHESHYIPMANSSEPAEFKPKVENGVILEGNFKQSNDFVVDEGKFPRGCLWVANLPTDHTEPLDSLKLMTLGGGVRCSNDEFATAWHVMDRVCGCLVLTGRTLGKSIVIQPGEYTVLPILGCLDMVRVKLSKPGVFNTLGLQVCKFMPPNPTKQVALFRRTLKDGVAKYTVSYSSMKMLETTSLYYEQWCNSAPGDSGSALFQGGEAVGLLIGMREDCTANVAVTTVPLCPVSIIDKIRKRLLRAVDAVPVKVQPETPTDLDAARRQAEEAAVREMDAKENEEKRLRMLGQHLDEQGFGRGRKQRNRKPDGPEWGDVDDEDEDEFHAKFDRRFNLRVKPESVNFKPRQVAALQKSPPALKETPQIPVKEIIASVEKSCSKVTDACQSVPPSNSSTNSPDMMSSPALLSAAEPVVVESKATQSSTALNGSQGTEEFQLVVKKRSRSKKKQSASTTTSPVTPKSSGSSPISPTTTTPAPATN